MVFDAERFGASLKRLGNAPQDIALGRFSRQFHRAATFLETPMTSSGSWSAHTKMSMAPLNLSPHLQCTPSHAASGVLFAA